MRETVHEEKVGDYTVKIFPDEDPFPPSDCDRPCRIYYPSTHYSFGDEHMSEEAIREIVGSFNPFVVRGYDKEGEIFFVLSDGSLSSTAVVYDDEGEAESAKAEFEEQGGKEDIVLCRVERRYSPDQAPDFDLCADEYLAWAPVSAYVHSGQTIWMGRPGGGPPGTNCPWDSGTAGIVVLLRSEALKCCGKEWVDTLTREKAMETMAGYVQEWDNYFTGNVYGYVVEDALGDGVDSCWGFYSDDAHPPWNQCLDEAIHSARWFVERDLKASEEPQVFYITLGDPESGCHVHLSVLAHSAKEAAERVVDGVEEETRLSTNDEGITAFVYIDKAKINMTRFHTE